MIAIFAALNAEVSSLKGGMSISKSTVHQDCRLYEGRCHRRDCVLVLTGVCKRRAQQAVETVLEKYPITTMISTGFSGALNHKTTIGDIVVYSELGCGNGGKAAQYLKWLY